jgi:Replication-relaxation
MATRDTTTPPATALPPAGGPPRSAARPALSPALMSVLAGRLTSRDRWLLRMLLEHRVLTTSQVAGLAYPGLRRAAARMRILYQLRAADRFRPLARTGTAPFHWVLDQAGAEVLAAEDDMTAAQLGYRHDRAIGIAWSPRLAHTAGANGVFTALAAAARRGEGTLACWWSERRCAALWGDLTRPDGYGLWSGPAGVCDFFLEYDTGSEDLGRVAAKLAGYADLAARTAITTPVLYWLASGARREQQLHAVLGTAAIPGVPVATATPAAGGPAGAVWLPAGQPHGPRLRLDQLPQDGHRPARSTRPHLPADFSGLPWQPPDPVPPVSRAGRPPRQAAP